MAYKCEILKSGYCKKKKEKKIFFFTILLILHQCIIFPTITISKTCSSIKTPIKCCVSCVSINQHYAILYMRMNDLWSKDIHLNYLAFLCFFLERIWWRLFQKRVMRTKLYIYAFIILSKFWIGCIFATTVRNLYNLQKSILMSLACCLLFPW